jgi:nucleotide-binding universal stress UspA family protein
MSHVKSRMDRALQDFHEARRQAALQEVVARLTGKSTKLLAFDDVSQKLKASGGIDRGVQEISLDAIVGSCERYEDFSRTFLPLLESDKERWARVNVHITTKGLADVPPILVYQIGQAYFVLDGNHRVSVARQLGATRIKADVTEFQPRVSLSPDDSPAELILKAEYADFLERTNLNVNRPQVDLRVTAACKYWILEAQIEAHRYLVQEAAKNRISYQEAAVCWYDGVYLGVVQVIRDRGLLQGFPNRTETDLYVWVFEHRASLKQHLDWDMAAGSVLTDLAVHHQPASPSIVKQFGRRVLDAVTPGQLTSGPKPGLWRHEKATLPHPSRLFFNVLVAITGEEKGWSAFEQSLVVARRERGRLRALHLVTTETEKEAAPIQGLRAEFNQRCQAAKIPGKLTIEVGPAVDKIVERAWLADLVVAPLLHPPGSQLITRLSSQFRTLVQRCARPVLAVPNQPSYFKQALLAYDGSPKAREALFVATYLARRWGVPLIVLTVAEDKKSEDMISWETESKVYLQQHDVEASFIQKSGLVVAAILETSAEYCSDLIIMGGYGHSPIKDLVLGSSVDQVLRESKHPILICR